jgi:hypothetical protein
VLLLIFLDDLFPFSLPPSLLFISVLLHIPSNIIDLLSLFASLVIVHSFSHLLFCSCGVYSSKPSLLPLLLSEIPCVGYWPSSWEVCWFVCICANEEKKKK